MSIHKVLGLIDDISDKITDQEYKAIADELMQLHKGKKEFYKIKFARDGYCEDMRKLAKDLDKWEIGEDKRGIFEILLSAKNKRGYCPWECMFTTDKELVNAPNSHFMHFGAQERVEAGPELADWGVGLHSSSYCCKVPNYGHDGLTQYITVNAEFTTEQLDTLSIITRVMENNFVN